MSKRPELGTVTVGQPVIVSVYRGRAYSHVRAVVVQAARVWITVEPADGEPSLAYYEVRFRLNTQRTGGTSNYEARFVTEAQYAWDQEQEQAKDVLRAARIDPSPSFSKSRWGSGDRLLALAAFVEKYDADHPEAAE